MPIDNELSVFNFYILTRGTDCSQGLTYIRFLPAHNNSLPIIVGSYLTPMR
jgi:hypothetical protein